MTQSEDPRDPDPLLRPTAGTADTGTTGSTDPAGAHVAEPAPVAERPVVREDAEPPPAPVVRRSISTGAHLTSVVVSVVALFAALVLLDYTGLHTTAVASTSAGSDQTVSGTQLVTAILAFVLALIAAGVGRISALGPLVAGLLWGVVPTVLALADPGRLLDWAMDVKDGVEIYDFQGLFLMSNPLLVFPAVAGLTLGAAFVGRWRGRLRQTTYDSYGDRW